MAPLADFLVTHLPLPNVPYHYTHYVVGKTPLSTTPEVVAGLVGYLVLVFGLREYMKDKQPLKLTTLFQLHNVLLSSGSLLLLTLMMEEIAPIAWKHGIFYAMCHQSSWTRRMEFYYMINYYFKYWELADTVFLALKKKPLAFLHVFHHSATALLCWSQLNGKTSVSWVVITLNLAVHVLMYYYYYATAGGAKIWWKKYLTSMQITQFVIDLFVVYFATYSYYASTHWASFDLPRLGSCAGTENAALFGCGLLTSYLFLFINFYIQTYKKPARAKPLVNGNSTANGVANGNGVVNGHAKGH
ncbi:elongase of fatty acids ELO [Punctularia strigosozonata HHB-11173 SS5]|uniref:elongase of fatty acids ELO n=1 Tax=Punctularia strigosozonata (strain HHB-11173) TaxID=741275 RepID=UPI0004416AC1|nr:elongase of fatty acids ELO [Punctularia strigosozonata HHB-11173 SS5]EIN13748.1 elongase of fatty acids ELO [Punctularia strigosozonata HHB-11173 SS5]